MATLLLIYEVEFLKGWDNAMPRFRKKPVKLRFVVAETTDDVPKPVYSEWFTDFAEETTPRGRASYNEYGTELNFDKVLIFEANQITRRISYNTVLAVDHYHLGNYKNGDYLVSYIYPEAQNHIVIGCNKVAEISNPKVYYLNENNDILALQMDYDYKALVGYVDTNRNIPFDRNTTMWHKYMPSSVDQPKNQIRFVSSEKVGLSDNYKEFLELKFEEVPTE